MTNAKVAYKLSALQRV